MARPVVWAELVKLGRQRRYLWEGTRKGSRVDCNLQQLSGCRRVCGWGLIHEAFCGGLLGQELINRAGPSSRASCPFGHFASLTECLLTTYCVVREAEPRCLTWGCCLVTVTQDKTRCKGSGLGGGSLGPGGEGSG